MEIVVLRIEEKESQQQEEKKGERKKEQKQEAIESNIEPSKNKIKIAQEKKPDLLLPLEQAAKHVDEPVVQACLREDALCLLDLVHIQDKEEFDVSDEKNERKKKRRRLPNALC